METTHNPNQNAANERSHKVIEELMRSLVQFPPFDWDEQLPIVEFAYNNAHMKDLGYSPMELATGETPMDPATLLFPVQGKSVGKPVQELLTRQTEILRRARLQLTAARQLVADRVNKTRIAPRFAQGQKVLLKTEHLKWPGVDLLGKKLKPKKIGPFEVVRLNPSQTAVELKFDTRTRVHPVQPVSRCELFVPDTRDRKSKVKPPTEFNEEGDEIGEIEKIVGHKLMRGDTYYLVKWKDFSSRHNTWEPKQQLLADGCRESIDDYENALAMLCDDQFPVPLDA